MIAYLCGRIVARDEQSVILDVNGVGYQVYLNERELQKLSPEAAEQTFYIYQHVREDANLLFGFASWQERKLFLALHSVSGIGPKTALSFLSRYTAGEIVNALHRGDAAFIASIGGVGKKTAEKVILELKDKTLKLFPELIMDKNNNKALPSVDLLEENFSSEIRLALNALGYTAREVEMIIRQHQLALSGLATVEEAVTYLLKHL